MKEIFLEKEKMPARSTSITRNYICINEEFGAYNIKGTNVFLSGHVCMVPIETKIGIELVERLVFDVLLDNNVLYYSDNERKLKFLEVINERGNC